jgi:glycosyltransferase involved in cell wall biosynthesis
MNSKINKFRVIFFLPVFSYGGAAESIVKLSKFLKKHNFSVKLISIGKNVHKKYLTKIGCDVYEINTKRAIFSILKLRSIIKNEIRKNYIKTILISNIHYANVITKISCFGLKHIKIIFTERSSLHELNVYTNFIRYVKNKIIFVLAKKLYKHAHLVIANSKYEKEYIRKNFNVKRIKYIYPPSIEKINRINIYDKIYKKKKHKKKIIYVGNLFREKGPITILKALSKITDKYNLSLEIFGNGYEEKNLKNFIKKNKLSKNILFKGFVKDKSKIFKNKDLFINASWYEGLSNALVQSINNNIFPICSKSPGGNLEVIKYGKLGLTFQPKDYLDLRKKISLYFTKNLKLNQKVRLNHLNNFTLKKSNLEYLKILKNL